MATPKYRLTVNDNERVENSYFKMPTITVEEVYEETQAPTSQPMSEKPLAKSEAAPTSSDAEEARKKELERIKKWIEDRRKAMEASKVNEPKEEDKDTEDEDNERPKAPVEVKRPIINDETRRDRSEEQKEIDAQRKLIEERRKKMEEMIAKMREAAQKEKEQEDHEDSPSVDQAHMLRKKVLEKGEIEVEAPSNTENNLKEELKKNLENFEKREENIAATLKDDIKTVVEEATEDKKKPEVQNKVLHDLNEILPPTKKEVHNIFSQLNNLKK